ncbi:unnamed protein product [Microthlaspi erraticum]|uniref:Uncharacterized protein n=1 Tax=Microthlaspi erraticum TaxID=1685480 RepID=A0A6D2IG15_9BRAS|nr:unnamed protein product [Microthlaspi erraticum]
MKPLIYPISNPNGAFKYKRIRFRVKGKSRGKQHFSGLTLTSQLDRVEAWPVELRNSTGWSSRRSSWSSRWLLPSSFAYPVELLPCAKSLHAPHHITRPAEKPSAKSSPSTTPADRETSGHDRSDSAQDPTVRPIVPTDRPNAAVDPKPFLKPNPHNSSPKPAPT